MMKLLKRKDLMLYNNLVSSLCVHTCHSHPSRELHKKSNAKLLLRMRNSHCSMRNLLAMMHGPCAYNLFATVK